MIPGSTIFVNGKGFLPFHIKVHMTKYGHILQSRGFDIDMEAAENNHTETVVPISEQTWHDKRFGFQAKYGSFEKYLVDDRILMACGARKTGGEMSPLLEYLNDHPRFTIKAPKPEYRLSEVSMKVMEGYALDVVYFQKRPYEKTMFLKWILKIHTGLDLGKHDDTQIYCYELANEFDELNGFAPLKERLIDIFLLWMNPFKETYILTEKDKQLLQTLKLSA